MLNVLNFKPFFQATSRTTKSATPHLFLLILHCICHHINSMGLYRSVRHDEQSGGRKCRGTKRGETTTFGCKNISFNQTKRKQNNNIYQVCILPCFLLSCNTKIYFCRVVVSFCTFWNDTHSPLTITGCFVRAFIYIVSSSGHLKFPNLW